MNIENWPLDIYVLLPGYKAARDLKVFLPRLVQRVPASNICVVDDGSGDATGSVCTGYGITCLSHAINRGKGAALRTGFAHCLKRNANRILTMDSDGQHAVDAAEDAFHQRG